MEPRFLRHRHSPDDILLPGAVDLPAHIAVSIEHGPQTALPQLGREGQAGVRPLRFGEGQEISLLPPTSSFPGFSEPP